MAGEKNDPRKGDIGGGVPVKAPSKEAPIEKKAPPQDRQNENNIAPGHGRRIPDKSD